jgi:hypothetical protein
MDGKIDTVTVDSAVRFVETRDADAKKITPSLK